MRSPIHTWRSTLAAGLSLWLAVLACLVGCGVPLFASSGASGARSVHQSSAGQGQPDVMSDMPDCPHHSSGNAPAQPNGQKPARGGAVACCPVEVTVASKPATVTLHAAPASDFVLASDFTLAKIRFFHSVEFVPPVWQSGRDTLLETQLLRI